MLSLSKKADYALLALCYLATATERCATAREISEQHGIPPELLAKILQRLKKYRLVVSAPGPTGGYRLARMASDISVRAIIEAVDGPPALTHCLKSGSPTCSQIDRCTVRAPLHAIHNRILQMLSLVSLQEISSYQVAPLVAVTLGRAGVKDSN